MPTADERALARVRHAVRGVLATAEPGAGVLVACSGGADSLALAAAAVAEAPGPGVRVLGVTVDHGLQDDSAEVAATTVARLAEIGVDETVTARVAVEADGSGPEAAAREARYAVLGQVAASTGASLVLLGHTRDDQAETVLLGLTRGSGGRSVAGMRRAWSEERGPGAPTTTWARPLLDVGREDTEAACRALGLDWWSDPHNDDPRFLRPRVRRTVLPTLEAELGPGVATTLARTGEQLRGDMELLDLLADELGSRAVLPPDEDPGSPGGPGAAAGDEAGEPVGPAYDVATLAAAPGPLRRRVLHRAALAAGAPPAELAHVHVVGAEALVVDWHGQRWADLPGPLRVVRRGAALRFTRP